jgi:FkbM family methyltransferase
VKDYGLVVIGAHFGVWLEKEISEYSQQNIILVEPVPYNNKVLEKKFSDFENISICKNAIFSKNKLENFYYVDENSIPKLGKHWASGIGSFDKKHILNHKSKRFQIQESDINTIEIDFITFNKLVEIYSIRSIDKLQIDVEGAEYEVLRTIDFKNIKIKKILFESKHFDGTFKEGEKLKEIKEKLMYEGYKLSQIDNENVLAEKSYL